ncbi:MAG: FAD:protein FMN transferase [Thermoleophilia bacterium]
MDNTTPMLDWTFRAMGADWRIHHGGGVSGEDAQAAADAVAADERLWSRFQATSDVSRISQGAGTAVEVAAATLDIVEAARDWSERTGGLFQPLLADALRAWGYRGAVGDDAPQQAPHVPAPVGEILISRRSGTITIPAGTSLDLGGIGKSWAAVRAGELLADRCDDERLIIDAGGDLAIIRGSHRIETAVGAVLAHEGEGIATSSSERRQWQLGDGTVAHHLIDPRTGAPSARGTAVVVGEDPVAADVLASCVVLDPAFLASLDVPAARIALDETVTTTDAWAEALA